MFDDKISKFINNELAKINSHIPQHRIPLIDALLGMDYIARDGQKYYIDQNEAEFISKICPKNKWDSLYLPIILLRKRELGEGTYVVGGEIIDEYVIARVLGLTTEKWDRYIKERKSDLYLYRPQVVKIRKILPTATTIAFI